MAMGEMFNFRSHEFKRLAPAERFKEQYMPEPMSGCWLWIGAENDAGYGRLMVEGKAVRAHRFSYELRNGTIPKGLHIDHLCRVRCCVNPDHLEAVSRKENILRGVGSPAQNARKTHCKRGHRFSGENLVIQNIGGCVWRQCRECTRIRARACYWRLKKRAA